MDRDESAWLRTVGDLLGVEPVIDDETKRLLLRVTKVTADATGIRYLAPLTAYLIGCAAGRAHAAGAAFDLPASAAAISQRAAGWAPPPG